ncbi:hypothetical protein DL93DRAFT_701345 [Clavulina sp. PMI_390]|nr:hypothetical protein DL93DRAFT_701345 [Clavulina sp. PMI_390]
MTTSFPPLKAPLKALLETPPRDTWAIPQLALPSNVWVLELPSPPREPDSFVSGFTVTSHIFPGAYPRYSFLEPRRWSSTSSNPILNDAPSDSAPKAVRMKWATERRDAFIEKCKQIYAARAHKLPEDGPGEKDGLGPVTWNVVNRYARVAKPGPNDKRCGITVISWHANGLHKETYEPTYRHLISLCDQATSTVRVDEFWSIEAANAGDSAIINGDVFGDYQDGIDHVRDALNFLEYYLPKKPYDSSPPLHLPHHTTSLSSTSRFLVALGHCFGGSVLANAACSRPSLFRSLTLVEPILLRNVDMSLAWLSLAVLTRRQHWKSREEAKSLLQQHPTFMPWTPEALDLYVRHALCDAPGGGVTLKMSRFVEAAIMTHAATYMDTWDMLERLPKGVRLRWIMAEQTNMSSKETMHNMVWLRKGNSSNVLVLGGNHFLVQQKPDVVAEATFEDWNDMIGLRANETMAKL